MIEEVYKMLNITADSRKIKKGDIFVAIRGIDGDGHDYIESAIEKGASKIIAEEGSYLIPYEIVDDTRAYLLSYLKKHYNPSLRNVTFVGITGTNGKTTISYLLYKALRLLGKKSAYIGTNGFYIEDRISPLSNSTPDIWDSYDMFIRAKESGCTYIIEEVSSHSLSFNRIEGYTFDYAVFTNLTQDHLDYHKTMGNYALAKQLLFKKLKKGGKAIVNVDDKYKDYYLLKENNNLTYGFTSADYMIGEFKSDQNGSAFSYEHKGNIYHMSTKLLGKYNAYNMLAVISVLTEMGFTGEELGKIIPKLTPPLGRMETIPYKENSIIVDYAHSPDSVEKAIKAIKDICLGNVYVVFGCTGDRDRSKRPIMLKIATDLATKVIVTTEDTHHEDPNQIVSDMIEGINAKNYEICLDRKKAIIKGIQLMKNCDALLILGRGHEDYLLIGDKRVPFNDKKVVLEYIQDHETILES